MTITTAWFLIFGALLVFMALTSSMLRRLPLSASILYLGVGFGLGVTGLLEVSLADDSRVLELATELAVIISLFTAGLKLQLPLSNRLWRAPLRLATISMLITIALVAGLAVALGLPIGVGVLLGAILAPTDPVLASDVQVDHPKDRDSLRFALTGEAGLNDGAAFPFVVLGLGLLGEAELGDHGRRWLAVDVVWAVAAGLAIGAACGTAIGRLVVHLRQRHKEAVGLDSFLALGLVALSYGLSLAAAAYGFLSVFAAGYFLQRVATHKAAAEPPAAEPVLAAGATDEATDPATAPSYMTRAVLGWNEQLERMAEVGVVVLVGGLLASHPLPWEALWLVPALLLVVRPLSTTVGLLGAPMGRPQRWLTAWFGVRGIGSLYYVSYAAQHGLDGQDLDLVGGVALAAVATSVFLHGISVTPLMRLYERRRP